MVVIHATGFMWRPYLRSRRTFFRSDGQFLCHNSDAAIYLTSGVSTVGERFTPVKCSILRTPITCATKVRSDGVPRPLAEQRTNPFRAPPVRRPRLYPRFCASVAVHYRTLSNSRVRRQAAPEAPVTEMLAGSTSGSPPPQP